MGQTYKEKQSMLLSTLALQYADYLHTDKPLSKTTVKNYLCRLRSFLRSLPEDAALSDLTKQSISRHLARVQQASSLAVRMHFAAIRRFTRFLVAEEWLRTDLCQGIPLPKVRYARRETIPDNAVQRLWESCDRLTRSAYKCALAKAVFSVLIFTGIRRGELVALTLENLFLPRGELYIQHGKGDKPRSLYLPKEAMEALREYLKLRPDCRHEKLFAQSATMALGYNYMERLLLDLHRVAGLDQNYTSHQLRHAYASRLARNGVPLPTIQAALGHARMETTARYLHTNEDDLRAAAHLASLSPIKPATTSERAGHTQTETAPTSPQGVHQREGSRRFQVRRLR